MIGLAGVGAAAAMWVWHQMFSRDAQIDALHRACTTEFAEAAARMKAGVQPSEGAGSVTKGLGDGLGRMIEGMSGSMSDTVCAAVRDACRDDFDGRICTAARERYR